MQYFISFQKKHALFLSPGTQENTGIAHQINYEMMRVGYILSQEAFLLLSQQTVETLSEIHRDLVVGFRSIIGSGNYEPIYRNFPQSVLALSQWELLINAISHYWSFGTWRPEDEEHLYREHAMETISYTEVKVISAIEFASIFSDILYSGTSISHFDKECLNWYIAQGGEIELSRILFHETWAYVCAQQMMNAPELPTKNATSVLRVWAAYSNGDEGLKDSTRFVNPNAAQRQMLLRTLEKCFNLEDSFKSYREPWLRVLFYLHPQTAEHAVLYPNVARYTDMLRNQPKKLHTLSSKIERAIADKDEVIFELLEKYPGIFMRRLDHLVRLFGIIAVQKWLALQPSFDKLVQIYNHFSMRGTEQVGRTAILASQSKSELVTYDDLEPLDEKLLSDIMKQVRGALDAFSHQELIGKKVFIDKVLYYTPFAMNNRASSLSLHNKTIGTCYQYTQNQTLRMYVHWEDKSDIDLSAFCIMDDSTTIKVGWNASYSEGDWIVYSGDNTGYADQNAEYIDLNTQKIPSGVHWIIVEARIYRGPHSFKQYNGKAKIGWMNRAFPEASHLWLPETTAHAMVLESDSSVCYLMAYHPVTRNIVYLDMSMGADAVSTTDDVNRFRIFLDRNISLQDGAEIQWNKLQQGHVLHLLSGEVVSTQEEADIVFDHNTTTERISKIIHEASGT